MNLNPGVVQVAKYVDIDAIEKYIHDNYSEGEIFFALIDLLNWLEAEPEIDIVEEKERKA